jgi:hypothetical protein
LRELRHERKSQPAEAPSPQPDQPRPTPQPDAPPATSPGPDADTLSMRDPGPLEIRPPGNPTSAPQPDALSPTWTNPSLLEIKSQEIQHPKFPSACTHNKKMRKRNQDTRQRSRSKTMASKMRADRNHFRSNPTGTRRQGRQSVSTAKPMGIVLTDRLRTTADANPMLLHW